MHGTPIEALVGLILWVFAGSTLLGVAFSTLALVAHQRCGQTLEVLIGAVCVAAVAYTLATFDLTDLGGHLAWRFFVFVVALSSGYVASRAIIRKRHASARTLRPIWIVVGFGAVAFATTGTAVLVLLVALSLTFS